MKKKIVKLYKGLTLDREIIAELNEQQLATIAGGAQTGNEQEQTTQTQSSCPVFSCNVVNCRGPLAPNA
jgi:hypothetical protein